MTQGVSLCVRGITLQDKFHTSRHPNFTIPTHELLQLEEVREVEFPTVFDGLYICQN